MIPIVNLAGRIAFALVSLGAMSAITTEIHPTRLVPLDPDVKSRSCTTVCGSLLVRWA